MIDDETRAEIASLRQDVKLLTTGVAVLSDRLQRRRIRDGVLAAVVAVMLVSGLWYFFIELPDRRADTRNQIRGLACYAVRLRPPGYSAASDDIRKRYDCPPFDQALLQPGAPTVAPTPSATITRSVPGPTRTVGAGAAPAPATRTATVTATPRAGALRTVTVAPRGRTQTRTVVRTVVRTVPGPTTTITRGICVAGLIC
jgi:hypothetical protein